MIHSAPSLPATMSNGSDPASGASIDGENAPAVVMRPMRWRPPSVNQSAPSGPAAMPPGAAPGAAIGNSVIVPVGVMRPIRLPSSV